MRTMIMDRTGRPKNLSRQRE